MKTSAQTIRKFNRFELKYVINLQQAEAFKKDLRAYMNVDAFGGGNGRYGLTSLYYDSPKLRCYWEKENGIRFRRKLRIRSYDSQQVFTEETPVFVEIKQRVDRVTQKKRTLMSYGDALRLCNDRQYPQEFDPKDQDFLDEVYAFAWQYNLRPASLVHYERQAFVGSRFDPGLRVTFDTNLTYQTHPLHLHSFSTGQAMLSSSQVVLEIKVNERMPDWMSNLISHHNLSMVRVSKYCRSIDVAQSMSVLPFLTRPAQPSREILSNSPSVFLPAKQKVKIKRNY